MSPKSVDTSSINFNSINDTMKKLLYSMIKLENYVSTQGYAGYDPYDTLNADRIPTLLKKIKYSEYC